EEATGAGHGKRGHEETSQAPRHTQLSSGEGPPDMGRTSYSHTNDAHGPFPDRAKRAGNATYLWASLRSQRYFSPAGSRRHRGGGHRSGSGDRWLLGDVATNDQRIDPAAQKPAHERRDPEQPELLERPASHEEGRPRAARRVHRGIGDGDADEMDERKGEPDRGGSEALGRAAVRRAQHDD